MTLALTILFTLKKSFVNQPYTFRDQVQTDTDSHTDKHSGFICIHKKHLKLQRIQPTRTKKFTVNVLIHI